jgi:hypothetical protein
VARLATHDSVGGEHNYREPEALPQRWHRCLTSKARTRQYQEVPSIRTQTKKLICLKQGSLELLCLLAAVVANGPGPVCHAAAMVPASHVIC